MPDRAVSIGTRTALRVEYHPLELTRALAPNVRAAVTFGATAPNCDPRFVRVGLEPLHGSRVMELWHGNGEVRTGTFGCVRYAADADHLFGVLELDEHAYGGIAAAAEAAYASLQRFRAESAHPYLLRVWNYFDAINRGTGDEERYKQFCIGRCAGFGPWPTEHYPAATVIGRRDGDPRLQVYWLCGKAPGTPIDNPRQVRPNRYPRQYGPRPPQFSRAMRVDERLVLISGTASIVGHASHHPGNLASQLDEVLNNLGSVLHKAAGAVPQLPVRFGPHTLLKIYLRDPADRDSVEAALNERLPSETPRILLVGDVCRADLLLEADGVHVT
jgi:chorismate lyase / 3-hydroxybenzoate synthase